MRLLNSFKKLFRSDAPINKVGTQRVGVRDEGAVGGSPEVDAFSRGGSAAPRRSEPLRVEPARGPACSAQTRALSDILTGTTHEQQLRGLTNLSFQFLVELEHNPLALTHADSRCAELLGEATASPLAWRSTEQRLHVSTLSRFGGLSASRLDEIARKATALLHILSRLP